MSRTKLNDRIISQAIIETFSKKLVDRLNNDVAIVGAGPAGLVAGYYLARKNIKVTLFERKLSIGGGMWGGGMMFNDIVVQTEGKRILDEFGVPSRKYRGNYYTADAVTSVTTICSKATMAGLQVFNLVDVEDVMLKHGKVRGLVINWSAVTKAGLHVDPITIESKFVVDATGHPCEVSHLLEQKAKIQLDTTTGGVVGESPMWADRGEQLMTQNTKEIFPNVYVAGMAANAVSGSPRMGPVFGGMLISGKAVANLILKRIKENANTKGSDK